MMSSSLGWTCSVCTYQHTVPGTRCAMCEHPRVTKEHMRDFIAGKTLPKNNRRANDNDTNKKPEASVKENRPPPPMPSAPAPIAAAAVFNPYAKKSTSTAPSDASSKPPPSSSLAINSNNVASIVRQPQQQSHSTFSAPAAPATNSYIGTGSFPPQQQRPAAAASRQASGSSMLPMKRQASAAGIPTQPGGQLSNTTTGFNTNSGFSRNAAQPKPPPNNTKNPFSLSKPPVRIPYAPGPVPLDTETASDWIYPIHREYPIRDYQLEISQTAVNFNTLVSLPTGLGKTLIASVVLYNFYRWFPTGKVIFLAPTLPLVNQQVKACYDIMGIPTEDTALLTGKVTGDRREGIWSERRVFFCTPQTVEKDLVSGRCPAKQVVCVVLDEAHKASGNYAYVKVVQHLLDSGAKFRILGLSATPGTGIKAIQEVVTALHIQKIEARLEDDENIKKYIHERNTEIVIVKALGVVNQIERLLDNVTAPLIKRLRDENGMATIRGNATLTSYCVHKAKEEYVRRTNDHRLNYYYNALRKLVQIRSNTRSMGIGVVRNGMIAFRNQATGLEAKIVREEPFKEAMEAVLRATSSDPSNINERAEDRKLNNPKLMKLDEILVEHFERARACGKSSRAIVFTQWRDSVSEIVAVLSSSQPLLRARHFVGQGKSSGGANKEKVDQSCESLKGMKQKEQQAVIREFREDVYNILVCTCIGEEGLDIGEVDLIVNYDSLRSPIRMIQRVGRTGRKRVGRVVCLVSEGAEERTMKENKSAQRTLGRALKKPDAFKVIRSGPMLPQKPQLNKVDMSTQDEFHMSQVGGNGAAGRTRRERSDADVSSKELSTNWRLTEAQETRRQAMLGDITMASCLESSDGHLSQAFRKRLLRARARSMSTYNNRRKSVPASFGVSRGILLKLERKHGKKDDRRLNNDHMTWSRRESGALNQLFPIERYSETKDLNHRLLELSVSALETTAASVESKLPAVAEVQETGSPRKESIDMKPPPPRTAIAGFDGANVTVAARPHNPYASLNTEGRDCGNMDTTSSVQGQQNVAVPRVPEPLVKDDGACAPASVPQVDWMQSVSNPPVEFEQFQLPAPESSSSEESSSDDDSEEEHERASERAVAESDAKPPVHPTATLQAKMVDPMLSKPQEESATTWKGDNTNPTLNNGLDVDAAGDQQRSDSATHVQLDDTMQGPALRLPTQESSDEEESSDESDTDDDEEAKPSKEIFRPPAEINVQTSTTEASLESTVPTLAAQQGGRSMTMRDDTKEEASPMLVDTPAGGTGDEKPPSASHTFDPHSDAAATPAVPPRSTSDSGAELVDTPETEATPLAAPSASTDSGADLVDTPQCSDAGRMPSRTMSSHDSQCDHAEDIVCSICYSGESPEDNPIVLCDGPNNDHTCPVAVHKQCYAIPGSLEGVEHWYCDVCALRQQQRPTKKLLDIQCFVCQKEEGPLKVQQDSSVLSWFHPQCRFAVSDQNAFCQYCATEGATRCAVDGCTEFAHPYCGLQLKKPWMAVAYAAEASSPTKLSSNDTIGCNIYCPQHKSQVCRALVRVGVDASSVSKSPSYVIVSSKLRDNNTGTALTGPPVQRKRLRKKNAGDDRDRPEAAAAAPASKSTLESIGSADQREQKRQRVRQRMKERTEGTQRCRFLDLEVDDSDEDGDGDRCEEDDARRIEEEEAFYKDFINDGSQLGYTQDDLDRLGLSETGATQAVDESGAVHRRVDAMRAKADQFKTPILNRRQRKYARGQENAATSSTSEEWDQPTPASEPSSSKGLGNMHFIRSVLEHQRNGGDVDDIEDMFHAVAQNASPLEQDRPIPQGNPAGPIVMACASSDSDDESSDDDDEERKMPSRPPASGPPGAPPLASRPMASAPLPGPRVAGLATGSTRRNDFVTADQIAKMERNRQEALKRQE